MKTKIILATRHLEDKDNLLKYGLDTPLKSSQKNNTFKLTETLAVVCKEKSVNNVDIYSSTSKRCMQTSKLLKKNIQKNNDNLNININPDKRIRALEKGDLILTELSYVDGEEFKPLMRAQEIFWEQSFKFGNYTYKFGDPLKKSKNKYHYPELNGVFSKYGECYAEFAIRNYDFLYDLSKNGSLYYNNIQPTLITHSTSLGLMIEIAKIAKLISKNFTLDTESRSLSKMTQQYYEKIIKNKTSKILAGESVLLDFRILFKPNISEILIKERDRLLALL